MGDSRDDINVGEGSALDTKVISIGNAKEGSWGAGMGEPAVEVLFASVYARKGE